MKLPQSLEKIRDSQWGDAEFISKASSSSHYFSFYSGFDSGALAVLEKAELTLKKALLRIEVRAGDAYNSQNLAIAEIVNDALAEWKAWKGEG